MTATQDSKHYINLIVFWIFQIAKTKQYNTQWMRSCTKESVNNEKVQKFVPVLDENLSVKSSPKLFAKYLEDKIFKIKIIQNISLILRTFLTLICIKWGPREPITISLPTIFAQKMPESSGSLYSSVLMLGNIWYYHFTCSGPNSQEFVNLFQFSSGPRGRTIGTKFTISCEFSPLQVKWWCHVFSNMK